MDIIPYKTYNQQLEIIKEKNIIVNSDEENKVIKRLENHSYYALINGFKPQFLIDGHADLMKDGTNFNHIYALKILDMDMSAILLKYLQIIEQGFRTRVAHLIARDYGTNDSHYLNSDLYVNTNNRRYKTLKHFKQLKDDPNKNSYSFYFKEIRKTSIPPWILIQDANFFNVINLYSCLSVNKRNEIREKYIKSTTLNNENNLFIDSMNLIREYRNIYAHSKRNFEEKINYHLDYNFTQFFTNNHMYNKQSFESNNKSKSLDIIILLILEYLNDEYLSSRFVQEISFLLLQDEYIDVNLEGNPIFNGQTIYEILDLPNNFFGMLLTENVL